MFDGVLPILAKKIDIAEAIRRHSVVVVCGATGSGKTTQLPQICREIGLADAGLIGHTQPRRLAARAVAARISEELGTSLGDLVGVKVRFDDRTSARTRIKLMTDGVLLAEISGDPDLRAYSCLIIDEAHERSLNIDLLLGLLRGVAARRPDLRVVVTSATIDPGRFSRYFNDAPVIEVSGRGYPVEIRYRAAVSDEEMLDRVEVDVVCDAVEELETREGDVLVFLPGEREIRAAAEALRRRGAGSEILPLFSRLTDQEQDRIFHPTDARRRVILATNIAETSLTVPGIRHVVDTGLARLSRYDPRRKVQGLPIEPISRASADQRAGRCGRVAPGVCIRLYSEASYRERPAFTDPEVLRTGLAGVILQLKTIGAGELATFPFIDQPDAHSVRDGYETLFELGAIDAPSPVGTITSVGRAMARVPADPRIARILLAASREGSLRECVVLAAALSLQDPRLRPAGVHADADRAQAVFRDDRSDFLTLLKLWDHYTHEVERAGVWRAADWCREHMLSAARMREWSDLIRQLTDVAEDLGLTFNAEPAEADLIHRALLTGLISNAACRDGDGFNYRGVKGNAVAIFPGSVLFKQGPKWIVAAELVETTRLYARVIARIEPEWIEDLAAHMFTRTLTDVHLDAQTGEPSAWERVTMNGIVVVPRRRTPASAVDPAAARRVFLREGLAEGRWTGDIAALQANKDVLERAKLAEAKLRRRGVIRSADEIVQWFESNLPASVRDPTSLRVYIRDHGDAALRLSIADVLTPAAKAAEDRELFPASLEVGSASCPIGYAFSPGREDDGVTLQIAVAELSELSPTRAAWLVPGLLNEIVTALVKLLPKQARAEIEARVPLADATAQLAGALSFGQGTIGDALSEAAEVLLSVRIPAGAWAIENLPAHLRLRIRVVDDHGKELGADRDLDALRVRFDGRIKKARAARARKAFERDGLTAWDFDELAESIDGIDGSAHVYPTMLDRGSSVALTLMADQGRSAALTWCGVRRLLSLACAQEITHHIDSLPGWAEMARQYHPFGGGEALRGDLSALIAERTFMTGQAPIRTRGQFQDRLSSQWGRLAAAAREVGDAVARTLEARARVAHRIGGGTPRIWAASIADIREHAVYLMPSGFLGLAGWERIRHYPRYSNAMRERLFSLREDGSGVEKPALEALAPHWKRFTGWVAAAMAQERAENEEDGTERKATGKGGKAPIPQTRRVGPSVNLDAGLWAMQPGNLPPAVETYRWLLEDYRAIVFSAEDASGLSRQLDEAWKKLIPPKRSG